LVKYQRGNQDHGSFSRLDFTYDHQGDVVVRAFDNEMALVAAAGSDIGKPRNCYRMTVTPLGYNANRSRRRDPASPQLTRLASLLSQAWL
jgi:hypothetical protein